jgi:hypothetical protein
MPLTKKPPAPPAAASHTAARANGDKLSSMCGRLTNATRGASSTKCTGAFGFFLDEAKRMFLELSSRQSCNLLSEMRIVRAAGRG